MTEIPNEISPKVKVSRKKLGWVFRTFFILAVSGTIIGTGAAVGTVWYFSRGLPQIMSVADYKPLGVTRILGSGGKEDALLAEFYTERRYVIPYEKIPDVVVKAFISAEDDKFFEHQGVNFASIIRAAIANFRAGHAVQGGSTITQQVVKSLLLTREKSLERKVKELILAHKIESNLSKKQILYLYLNQIYLGHGAYGVEAAARTYYHKSASSLNLAEAAVLAGLPQAPGKYSPNLNPKHAKERQLYVLRRMYENKFITQAQMSESSAQALKIYDDEDINTKYSGYLVEYLRKYLVEKYGEDEVFKDGLTVIVPSSPELSLAARESLQDGLRAIDKRVGFRGAVQKLKNSAEIEKFLKDERIGLIKKKIGYQMFLPDGRNDPIEALKASGLITDVKLLDTNQIYQAVVTNLDDKKKIASVMIGAIRADLPVEHMKWAKSSKDLVPSQLLSKGDVIWIKLVKVDKDIIVALDQEPQVQGALLSIEVETGAVLAMEGGYDFKQNQFNRAVQAQRQPGSSFKPFIYSAGIEKGYTPATVIQDSPLVYGDDQNGKWKPSNFEEKFYGDTTFRQALIKSRNIPTIKIVQSITLPFLLEYTKRLGISGTFPQDFTISLGSASVSLFELTKAYALFPRLGRKVEPVFITSIKDRDGRVLEEHKADPAANLEKIANRDLSSNKALNGSSADEKLTAKASPIPDVVDGTAKSESSLFPLAEDPAQVLDPRVAYVMTHLMNEVVNYGTGHEAKNLGRSAAGKTGTTNDSIDAWFMGFTPQVVTGVWVGFDNQKSIGHGETGAKAALPIWLNYMKEAVKYYPNAEFQVPPGVVFANIDPVSGKLSASNSSQAIREAFIEGTQPTETASAEAAKAPSQGDFLKEDIE